MAGPSGQPEQRLHARLSQPPAPGVRPPARCPAWAGRQSDRRRGAGYRRVFGRDPAGERSLRRLGLLQPVDGRLLLRAPGIVGPKNDPCALALGPPGRLRGSGRSPKPHAPDPDRLLPSVSRSPSPLFPAALALLAIAAGIGCTRSPAEAPVRIGRSSTIEDTRRFRAEPVGAAWQG